MSQVPAESQGSNLPVVDGQWQNTGLEDFKPSDAVLPRIKIVQAEGLWEDNLSGAQMEVLRLVILGLVKQRVLFHHNVDEGDVPMCKSSDYEVGYPNPDTPEKKSFPWELSGFDPKDFPADSEGTIKLPCDGCQLKEWGTHPANENPYCSEQWTLPIYYDTDPNLGGEFAPAILTLQKSSIKPIRTYLTSFAQSNKPPFLAIARATLKTKVRGSVTYSVPTFTREGESDRDRWMEFSTQFGEMRQFLTRPPVQEDVDQPTPSDNANKPPIEQPASEDPWAAPKQQDEPASPPPTQTPPDQQSAPTTPQPQQTSPPPAGQELPF